MFTWLFLGYIKRSAESVNMQCVKAGKQEEVWMVGTVDFVWSVCMHVGVKRLMNRMPDGQNKRPDGPGKQKARRVKFKSHTGL